MPKQLQNNFQQVQQTTFLSPKVSKWPFQGLKFAINFHEIFANSKNKRKLRRIRFANENPEIISENQSNYNLITEVIPIS